MQREPREGEGEKSQWLVHGPFPAAVPLRAAEAVPAKEKLREVGSMDEEGKGQWKGDPERSQGPLDLQSNALP